MQLLHSTLGFIYWWQRTSRRKLLC